MPFKKICFSFIFLLLLTPLYADQLAVTGNMSWDDTVYSGNTGIGLLGAGVYADTQGPFTVTLPSPVSYSLNNVNGIYFTNNGVDANHTLSIAGSGSNQLILNNNTDSGIMLHSTNMTSGTHSLVLNLTNSSAIFDGNNYGINIDGNAVLNANVGSTSRQNFIFKNNITGSMFLRTGGVMNINNMDIISSDSLFTRIMGSGHINITNSNINFTGATAFQTSGLSMLDFTNANIQTNGGAFLIGSAAQYLRVSNSAITGKIHFTTGAQNFTRGFDLTNSRWDMLESSVINSASGYFFNVTSSTINTASKTSGTFTTLTVDDISSSSSNFLMQTELGADDSYTDLIRITDSSNGDAVLKITNSGGQGGTTTGDGIMVVEDMGGAANLNLSLSGGKLDYMGYEYNLYKGGIDPEDTSNENNWFLRTDKSPVVTNTFNTMVNAHIMTWAMVKNGLSSLMKRLGDLKSFDNTENNHAVWARTYADSLKVKDNLETKMTVYGLEAGYDYLLFKEASKKLYLGIMGGYLYDDRIKTKQNDGSHADGDGYANSLGAYLVFVNDEGYYADLTFRNFWSDINMTNYAADGTAITYDPKRNTLTAGIEVGKDIKSIIDSTSYFRFEPKIVFTYGYMGSENVTASTGADLNYSDANYYTGRAGLLFGYTKTRENGLLIEPFAELSYLHEFDGKTNVKYGGAEYDSDLSGGSVLGTLGFNMQLSKNVYIYVEGNFEKGVKMESFGGNAGIRYSFGFAKKEKTEEIEELPNENPDAVSDEPEENLVNDGAEEELINNNIAQEEEAAEQQAEISVPAQEQEFDVPIIPIQLAPVYFAFAKADIAAKFCRYLEEKAVELGQMKYRKITVTGHTDSIGSRAYNQKLSERRAEAVAGYLSDCGVDKTKITVTGAGPDQPAASNATPEGRKANRRVEISVE